jgi:hypothetical protein
MKQCESQREEDATIVVVHDEDIPLVIHPHTHTSGVSSDPSRYSTSQRQQPQRQRQVGCIEQSQHNVTGNSNAHRRKSIVGSWRSTQKYPSLPGVITHSSVVFVMSHFHHIFTFWASLVPALLLAMKENDVLDDRRQQDNY